MRCIFVVLALIGCATYLFAPSSASATITMTPLTTWSPNNDGWLAPGEGGYAYLGTGSNERGLAYGNGHIYLVSRTGGTNIRVLDPATGADLGIPLITSGVSGGLFAVDMAAVGSDGSIFVDNLTLASTATGSGQFKIYRWATESSTPSTVYAGAGGLTGARIGDSLATDGSVLVAGYNSSPAVSGNNGYVIVNPTTGTPTRVAFSATPPGAGDFKLGITFTDSSHVLGGAQATSQYRYTSFSGTSGTLISSPTIPDPAGASQDRLLAYTVVGGQPLLAVQSVADSHVSIYDVSDPSAPVWIASGNNTSGTLATNSFQTGQLAWGAITDNGDATFSQSLYAMSANQGIQAFTVGSAGACGAISSNGSCLTYNDSGVVSAKKNSSTQWVDDDLGFEQDPLKPRHHIKQVVSSEGNFAASNDDGVIAAWNQSDSRWTNDGYLGSSYDPAHPDYRLSIEKLVGSGGNFAASNTNGNIAVWSRYNSTWTIDGSLSGGLVPGYFYHRFSIRNLIGSGGNFVASNNNGEIAAWNQSNSTWTAYGGLSGGLAPGYDYNRFSILDLIGSEGNFAAVNTDGTIAAWNQSDSTWTINGILADYNGDPLHPHTRIAIKQLVGAKGNFAAANSDVGVSAWNQQDSRWTDFSLSSPVLTIFPSGLDFIAVASDGTAAAWQHTTSQWTATDRAGAVQLLTGGPPQPATVTYTKPVELWSSSSIWSNNTQPTIGSIINLTNTTNPTQQLTVNAIASAYSLDIQGNSGTTRLNVTTGGELSVLTNVIVHTGGEIRISGGTLASPDITLTGGALTGAGRVRGSLTNNGVVSSGASPGVLTLTGNYTQGHDGTLAIEIGGILAGEAFDQLLVNGTATLDGTLTVTLINGFVPSLGQTFDVFDWNSSTGAFSSINLPTLNGSLSWDTSQLFSNGVLAVTNGLAGDINDDHAVNAADFVTWRKGLGTQFTDSGYGFWRTHFGETAVPPGTASLAPVPEPHSFALVFIAAAGIFFGRRRPSSSF